MCIRLATAGTVMVCHDTSVLNLLFFSLVCSTKPT